MGLFGKKKKKEESAEDVVSVIGSQAPDGGMPDFKDIVADSIASKIDEERSGFLDLKEYLVIGGRRHVSTLAATIYPREVGVGWVDNIVKFGDLDLCLHLTPGNNKTDVDALNDTIGQKGAELYLEQKRGNEKQVDELNTIINDSKSLRQQIQLGTNRLVYVTTAVSLGAENLEELRYRVAQFEDLVGGQGIHFREMSMRQDEAFRTVTPLGFNELWDMYRNFDLHSASTIFPFFNAGLSDRGGIPLGFDWFTQELVLYNQFLRTNYGIFVFGVPGAGKSVTVKLLTGRRIALKQGSTCIIDPEGEYAELVQALGGEVVYFSLREEFGDVINPLDVEDEWDEKRKCYFVDINTKIGEIKDLFEAMFKAVNQGKGMTAEENALLEEALIKEYKDRLGISEDPESLFEKRYTADNEGLLQYRKVEKEMPTISSVLDAVAGLGEMGARFAKVLSPYRRGGSLGIFDGQSTVVLRGKQVISFDISRVSNKQIKPVMLHVLLTWIEQKYIKKNRDVQKAVLLDEAHLYMDNVHTAKFLDTAARRARKYNAGLVVVTQDLKSFQKNEYGASVIEFAETKILLKQSEETISYLKEVLRLTEGEMRYLLGFSSGMALIRAGRERVICKIDPTPEEWPYLNTNPNAVAEARL